MDRFSEELQRHIETVERIGDKIENGENYMEDMKGYLPALNQMMTGIFQILQEPASPLGLNQGYVVQVLNDILYGIEHRDSVFLLDVLRYGLLEIYHFLEKELQSEGVQ